MIDDDDCGAVCGIKISRGNRSTRRKPAPMPLRPPQITHDLTRARTLAAAVGSLRLTAWAMARPMEGLKCPVYRVLKPFSYVKYTWGAHVNSQYSVGNRRAWYMRYADRSYKLFFFRHQKYASKCMIRILTRITKPFSYVRYTWGAHVNSQYSVGNRRAWYMRYIIYVFVPFFKNMLRNAWFEYWQESQFSYEPKWHIFWNPIFIFCQPRIESSVLLCVTLSQHL
jgi:hypothetical protein